MEIQNVTKAARAPRSADPAEAQRARGFSLLELIMTMTVAAVLLTIAVPSFRYVTNSNRIAGEINGLVGDLQFARSEAIKEGQYITVCASSDGATCSGSVDWQSGWIVFLNTASPPALVVPPTESPLRIQKAFSSTDTFEATNGLAGVTFNRDGYAYGIANGTIITLHDSTSNSAWTRCASIALSGQITTEMSGTTNNGATCT